MNEDELEKIKSAEGFSLMADAITLLVTTIAKRYGTEACVVLDSVIERCSYTEVCWEETQEPYPFG